MKKRNSILVIDDDEGILEGFSAMLEDYNVETAVNADSVFTSPKEKLPGLILLDVLLSGQDGREICKALKSHRKTKKIPVIMVSAHPKIEKSIKESGADDFLAKPFEMEDLLSLVKKYLGSN